MKDDIIRKYLQIIEMDVSVRISSCGSFSVLIQVTVQYLRFSILYQSKILDKSFSLIGVESPFIDRTVSTSISISCKN